MSEADWDVFNPGFDHGEVTVRKANIDGVFSADKLRLEDQHTDVRTANLPDNIGEEGFDWQSVDVGGADVRVANCRGGQLGSDSFNWSAVPGSADVVRSANLGSAIDESAFDAIDKAGADVRPANCPGQVGDRAFDGLVAKQQTPLTFMQRAWRLAAFPLALVPFSAITPSMAAAPKRLAPFLGASIAAVGLLGVRALLKRVLLVKQGTLCFVQYAENGTTHVLQAGVHLGAPETCRRPLTPANIELEENKGGATGSLMLSMTQHRARTCLSKDDLQGLNFLYPSCDDPLGRGNALQAPRRIP